MARLQLSFSSQVCCMLAVMAVMQLTNCGGTASSGMPGALPPFSGSSGSSSGAGAAGSGSGSGSGGSIVPSYGGGTGAAGQNSAAQFLYAAPVPNGGPVSTRINQQNGALAAVTNPPATPQNYPMMLAIDPSGTYLYETSQQGIWAYTINRQSGQLTQMTGAPYDRSQSFVSITVDQLGKFVYATGSTGVWGYSIRPGGPLKAMAGSPFPTAAPSNQFGPSSNLAIDQRDKFLYVTASAGIFAFTIDPNSGALAAIGGSPFEAGKAPLSLLITPSNRFLYETNLNDPTTHGYSIDHTVDANRGNLALVPNSFFIMNNSFSGAVVSLAITK